MTSNCRIFKRILSLILILLTNSLFPHISGLYAQVQNENWKSVFENLAESIAERSNRQYDYTSLIEQLENLIENPVAINSADLQDLEKLAMLNDFQVKSLYSYIIETGQIISLYELQFVYGFDRSIVELLTPFITIEDQNNIRAASFHKPLRNGRHQLFLRAQRILEKQEGYRELADSGIAVNPSSKYLGSPWRLYTRYGFSYKNRLAFGFTAEKDPGEEYFKGSNRLGYDFYSGFIQVNNLWKVKTLVIGDYEPRFGQGLTLWSGLNLRKSVEVLMLEKRRNEIRKYSSTNENQYFRGLGATFDLGIPELSIYVSSKKIDANVLIWDTINNRAKLVSGFDDSGLPATHEQIKDKNSLNEPLLGFNLNIKRNRFKAGLTTLHYIYNAEVVQGNQPYELFNFHGNSGSKIGADYRLVLRSGFIFGEIAFNPGYGWAFLQGGIFPLHETISLALLYRNYGKDFQPLYSNAFGENTNNSNENGFYIGTRFHPFRFWRFSAYFDVFSFPWLKWNTGAPSKGWDYLIQADYTPNQDLQMYVRIQNEKKEENISGENKMIKTGERNRIKLRYQISYSVSPVLELRNRVEWAGFIKNEKNEQGYLLYQDIIYKAIKYPLDITFRFAMFDTDSYNTRIYAYENDLLYAFSIPPYYGKGIRTYLLIHSAFNRYLDLWFRISRTSFTDRNIIGSGLNKIAGNNKTEIKLQARIKF